ncbi:MAG: hypothetical protein JWL81_1423 [Verrucomicrobiales bacterium]|nr:hypothetical protein [Verrucomicrobiales bacterium]
MEAVSDTEILCAFQERFIAFFGVPYSFPALANGASPVFPQPGDYSTADLQTIIGLTIFNRLSLGPGPGQGNLNPSTSPLYYLEGDIPDRPANWAAVHQNFVTFPGSLSYYSDYETKRREIAGKLNRMRRVVVGVEAVQPERRTFNFSTPTWNSYLMSLPSSVTSLPKAAQQFNDTAWSPLPVNPGGLSCLFSAATQWSSYNYNASVTVDRAKLVPPSHLRGFPFRTYMAMQNYLTIGVRPTPITVG